MTLGDMIRRATRRYPEKAAFRDLPRQRVLSYAEMNSRINQLAHGLKNLGIRKGDVVGIYFYNSHHFCEALYACAKIGAVAALLNFRLAAREYVLLFEQCEISTLIYDTVFQRVVEEIKPRLPGLKQLVAAGAGAPGAEAYEDLLAPQPSSEPTDAVDSRDLAVILFTGGTTGIPKAPFYTHEKLCWVAYANCVETSLTPQDVIIDAAPFFHSAGLMVLLMPGIVVSAEHVVPPPSFNPEEVLRIIAEERVTYGFFVPTQAVGLTGQAEEVYARYDTSCLRTWASAAAPLPTELKRRILHRFPQVRLFEMYGSTDSSLISSLRPEDQERKEMCVGRPFTSAEFRVVDENENDCPPGAVGEVWARVESTMLGYYRNPEGTAASLTPDGYWISGDMGKVDAEGYLYIVDRKKDMIITGGENVYSPEVESVLFAHPAVLEAAVIGVPDLTWGEAVKAVVVLKPGQTVEPQELVSHCRANLAHYKCPKTIDIVPELIKSSAGKILKREMRKWYQPEG